MKTLPVTLSILPAAELPDENTLISTAWLAFAELRDRSLETLPPFEESKGPDTRHKFEENSYLGWK